jgi:NTP pyrophosphatase (non-canonical NTP hydrolase)
MGESRSFRDVIDESLKVISEFKKVEKKQWGVEGTLIELSKQVGELAKNVMMFEGYYMAGRDVLPEYQTSREKITDELSDILFMTIRLADHYGIDLEKEHFKQLELAMKNPLMKFQKSNPNLF